MNWTKEQEQVIRLRNCNILVSAAAGSGKTAVLIERILSRILDRQNPVNVDEFLIVTFTKAAAAQMKERLQRALEEALAKDPDNEHLQRQIMLVPMAQISTIHSFCGYVIQNYFHRTGVDPAYRVGTESELGMVRADVMQEMLEEKYAEEEDGFMKMAAMSRFVKSDAEIEQIVQSLYEQAVSDPFPVQFLERMKEFVRMDTVEELKGSSFVKQNMEYVKCLVGGILAEYRSMLACCDSPGGPVGYRDVLLYEQEQFGQLLEVEDYEQLGLRVKLFEWKRLPGKKQPDLDEQKREMVKDVRNAVKSAMKALAGDLFDRSFDDQLEQLRQMRGNIITFLDLTLAFMERYRARKSEKSLVDFNDLEQMAMDILVETDDEGNVRRTEAAEELAEQFAEIMIDEYQDSNLVQEMLLGSVSSEHNRFMVGDIKQSIYRFRMACPDLFLDKLNEYDTEEGAADRLVNLSRNFRSREVVLEGTNAVFEKIMHRELGGVEYDEQARLCLGADFPQTDRRTAQDIDVFVIDGKDDGSYEGKMIAEKIHEYTGEENPLYVLDGEDYRKASYGDIVILARSTKAIGQQIYDVLASEGIPVHMEHTRGFFDTREISIMVNLFQIIDNPRQDIPLAAVLRSPIFDFTDDELAILRAKTRESDFYGSVLSFVGGEQEEMEELRQKVSLFLDMLNRFREKMTYLTVAEMIQYIYDCTHIDYILMAMKNGIQRKANLDALMEIAREFDSTSYRGLYQFVRYISGIRKREEDMGEANLLGNNDDVVRIMTIHKSKGLEFPICILAGMGRKMTGPAGKAFLAVNPAIGIASRVVDREKGISVNNTFYRSLLRMNELEDLGEELRVLYVAMTRAKEKLVLTGTAEWERIPLQTDYFQLIRGKHYFDWVLPAIRDEELFSVHRVRPEELEEREIRRQADEIVDEVMLYNCDTNFIYDEKTMETLSFMEEYEEEEREELPTKLSVSELKKRSMEEHREDNFTVLDSEELEEEIPVPRFAQEKEESPAREGASYGTVWHQVMAGLDFSSVSSEKEVEIALKNMVKSGRVRNEDVQYINTYKLMKLLESPLGQELREAKSEGKLFREQPFVIGVCASEVVPDTGSEETVLIQGIMDAFYETGDGIVLLDYKTDHLEEGQEQMLARRYQKQMDLYARALEGITGKTVIRKILYSFSLSRAIEL